MTLRAVSGLGLTNTTQILWAGWGLWLLTGEHFLYMILWWNMISYRIEKETSLYLFVTIGRHKLV